MDSTKTEEMENVSSRVSWLLRPRSEPFQPLTLLEFIVLQQKRFFQTSGEFSQLINSLQTAIKGIATLLRRAPIKKMNWDRERREGHFEKELYHLAEDLFITTVSSSKTTSLLVTKMNAVTHYVEPEMQGKYVVVFDALSGYKDWRTGSPTGTIFGIYRQKDREPGQQDWVRPGNQLTAAGYALYGVDTHLMISLGPGEGVNEFTLDPEGGEFTLTEKGVRVPARGKVYSVNEGLSSLWDTGIQGFINSKKNPRLGQRYEYRHMGSVVADLHRTLKQGGLLMMPPIPLFPSGKLSMVFECSPLGWVTVEAGGAASSGQAPVLEAAPDHPLATSPLFLGSTEDVHEAISRLAFVQETALPPISSENSLALGTQ